MEIPKSFIPNKDLDTYVKKLLKKQYKTTEERQWEIANRIAKYLVEVKELKYNNVFYADDKNHPLLLETAEKLDLEHEVEKFFLDIVGKINNQLYNYWYQRKK